jgi:cytochrome c biogenesis protein CcdA
VLGLIVLVVSVALADAINPSTLAPALLLATERGAAKRLAEFTLGVFVVSLAGGLALLLGPGQLALDLLPHPGRHARHVAELVGGVVLLGLAVALWHGRHHLAERLARADSGKVRGGAFALGAGIMALELPTALPYFAAIGAILASRFSLPTRILLVVVYNVVFVSPLLALLALRELLGEPATARIEAIGAWMRERAPALLAGLFALLGFAVAAWGAAALLT